MSWSTWGLAHLADDAPHDAVLSAGGRLLVLGADEFQYVEDELSERWSVTVVNIPKSPVDPRRGDLVLWRLVPREDPDNWSYWGGPSRVLTRSDGGKAGQVELCLLEDATLEAPGEDRDLTALLDPTSRNGPDGCVMEQHKWAALGGWGLTPRCPRCDAPSRRITYGLSDSEDARSDAEMGGCVVSPDQPQHVCVDCRYQF